MTGVSNDISNITASKGKSIGALENKYKPFEKREHCLGSSDTKVVVVKVFQPLDRRNIAVNTGKRVESTENSEALLNIISPGANVVDEKVAQPLDTNIAINVEKVSVENIPALMNDISFLGSSNFEIPVNKKINLPQTGVRSTAISLESASVFDITPSTETFNPVSTSESLVKVVDTKNKINSKNAAIRDFSNDCNKCPLFEDESLDINEDFSKATGTLDRSDDYLNKEKSGNISSIGCNTERGKKGTEVLHNISEDADVWRLAFSDINKDSSNPYNDISESTVPFRDQSSKLILNNGTSLTTGVSKHLPITCNEKGDSENTKNLWCRYRQKFYKYQGRTKADCFPRVYRGDKSQRKKYSDSAHNKDTNNTACILDNFGKSLNQPKETITGSEGSKSSVLLGDASSTAKLMKVPFIADDILKMSNRPTSLTNKGDGDLKSNDGGCWATHISYHGGKRTDLLPRNYIGRKQYFETTSDLSLNADAIDPITVVEKSNESSNKERSTNYTSNDSCKSAEFNEDGDSAVILSSSDTTAAALSSDKVGTDEKNNSKYGSPELRRLLNNRYITSAPLSIETDENCYEAKECNSKQDNFQSMNLLRSSESGPIGTGSAASKPLPELLCIAKENEPKKESSASENLKIDSQRIVKHFGSASLSIALNRNKRSPDDESTNKKEDGHIGDGVDESENHSVPKGLLRVIKTYSKINSNVRSKPILVRNSFSTLMSNKNTSKTSVISNNAKKPLTNLISCDSENNSSLSAALFHDGNDTLDTQNDQSVTTDDQSVTTSDQSVTTSDQSVTTSDQSVTTSDQSVTTSDQSVTTSDQYVTTSDQSVTTDDICATTNDLLCKEKGNDIKHDCSTVPNIFHEKSAAVTLNTVSDTASASNQSADESVNKKEDVHIDDDIGESKSTAVHKGLHRGIKNYSKINSNVHSKPKLFRNSIIALSPNRDNSMVSVISDIASKPLTNVVRCNSENNNTQSAALFHDGNSNMDITSNDQSVNTSDQSVTTDDTSAIINYSVCKGKDNNVIHDSSTIANLYHKISVAETPNKVAKVACTRDKPELHSEVESLYNLMSVGSLASDTVPLPNKVSETVTLDILTVKDIIEKDCNLRTSSTNCITGIDMDRILGSSDNVFSITRQTVSPNGSSSIYEQSEKPCADERESIADADTSKLDCLLRNSNSNVRPQSAAGIICSNVESQSSMNCHADNNNMQVEGFADAEVGSNIVKIRNNMSISHNKINGVADIKKVGHKDSANLIANRNEVCNSQISKETSQVGDSQITKETSQVNNSLIIEEIIQVDDSQITKETSQVSDSQIIEEIIQVDDSQIIKETSQISDSQIIEEIIQVDDSQITKETNFVSDSQITNETSKVYNSQITNETNSVSDSQITNETSKIDNSQITNETNSVSDSQITNETSKGDNSQITNETNSVSDSQITNETSKVDNSQITNETNSVSDSQITNETSKVYDSQITNEPSKVGDNQITNEIIKSLMTNTTETQMERNNPKPVSAGKASGGPVSSINTQCDGNLLGSLAEELAGSIGKIQRKRKIKPCTKYTKDYGECLNSEGSPIKRKKLTIEPPLNMEELYKPLIKGYVREVVFRSIISGSSHCDIYYRPPNGPKLRSRNDVASFLAKIGEELTLENFTFHRSVLGFGEPFEIVRNAGVIGGRQLQSPKRLWNITCGSSSSSSVNDVQRASVEKAIETSTQNGLGTAVKGETENSLKAKPFLGQSQKLKKKLGTSCAFTIRKEKLVTFSYIKDKKAMPWKNFDNSISESKTLFKKKCQEPGGRRVSPLKIRTIDKQRHNFGSKPQKVKLKLYDDNIQYVYYNKNVKYGTLEKKPIGKEPQKVPIGKEPQKVSPIVLQINSGKLQNNQRPKKLVICQEELDESVPTETAELSELQDSSIKNSVQGNQRTDDKKEADVRIRWNIKKIESSLRKRKELDENEYSKSKRNKGKMPARQTLQDGGNGCAKKSIVRKILKASSTGLPLPINPLDIDKPSSSINEKESHEFMPPSSFDRTKNTEVDQSKQNPVSDFPERPRIRVRPLEQLCERPVESVSEAETAEDGLIINKSYADKFSNTPCFVKTTKSTHNKLAQMSAVTVSCLPPATILENAHPASVVPDNPVGNISQTHSISPEQYVVSSSSAVTSSVAISGQNNLVSVLSSSVPDSVFTSSMLNSSVSSTVPNPIMTRHSAVSVATSVCCSSPISAENIVFSSNKSTAVNTDAGLTYLFAVPVTEGALTSLTSSIIRPVPSLIQSNYTHNPFSPALRQVQPPVLLSRPVTDSAAALPSLIPLTILSDSACSVPVSSSAITTVKPSDPVSFIVLPPKRNPAVSELRSSLPLINSSLPLFIVNSAPQPTTVSQNVTLAIPQPVGTVNSVGNNISFINSHGATVNVSSIRNSSADTHASQVEKGTVNVAIGPTFLHQSKLSQSAKTVTSNVSTTSSSTVGAKSCKRADTATVSSTLNPSFLASQPRIGNTAVCVQAVDDSIPVVSKTVAHSVAVSKTSTTINENVTAVTMINNSVNTTACTVQTQTTAVGGSMEGKTSDDDEVCAIFEKSIGNVQKVVYSHSGLAVSPATPSVHNPDHSVTNASLLSDATYTVNELSKKQLVPNEEIEHKGPKGRRGERDCILRKSIKTPKHFDDDYIISPSKSKSKRCSSLVTINNNTVPVKELQKKSMANKTGPASDNCVTTASQSFEKTLCSASDKKNSSASPSNRFSGGSVFDFDLLELPAVLHGRLHNHPPMCDLPFYVPSPFEHCNSEVPFMESVYEQRYVNNGLYFTVPDDAANWSPVPSIFADIPSAKQTSDSDQSQYEMADDACDDFSFNPVIKDVYSLKDKTSTFTEGMTNSESIVQLDSNQMVCNPSVATNFGYSRFIVPELHVNDLKSTNSKRSDPQIIMSSSINCDKAIYMKGGTVATGSIQTGVNFMVPASSVASVCFKDFSPR